MNFPDPNNYLTESFVCTWNILRSLLYLLSLICFGGIYVSFLQILFIVGM